MTDHSRRGRGGYAGFVLPAITLLCAMLTMLHAGCTSDADKPQEHVVIPPNAPDDETWRTTILFTDSVRMKARLTVGHARRYVNKMETLLDSNVYVEFYDSKGAINATLIADSARIDDRTKDMVAFGNVHVNSDNNLRTVDTDQLHWSNDRRTFFSDKRVKIIDRRDDRVIEGVGFESDDGLSNYRIFNASGQFRQP